MFKRSFLYMVLVSILLSSGCFIEGKVVDVNGVGVPGVTVTLSGDQARVVTTNSEGKYRFGDVFIPDIIPEGAYTVTPSKSGYSFTPAGTDVTVTTQTLEDYGDVPWLVVGVNFVADFTGPGLPETKLSYTVAYSEDLVQGTADHYNFIDHPDDYTVFTKTFHSTEFTVAIHNSNSPTRISIAEWADTLQECWHRALHVFGGYRYDRYAVLARPSSSTDYKFSLSEVGVSVHGRDIWDIFEFMCHEMLHSWLGKLIAHEPDGTENLFQKETWLSEGGVVYYSFRLLGDVLGEEYFTQGMDNRLATYQEAVGGPYDLSIQGIADLVGREGGTGPEQTAHAAVPVLYARGAIIAYMLDAELDSMGHSLDDLMKYIYVQFGLKDIRWNQKDIKAALLEITGHDFSGFFDTYLETNAPLNVTSFQFIKRD